MNKERFQRVSDLFARARQLGVHERDLFLVKACDGDDDLRCEVEQLLNASQEPLPFAELADDLRGARQEITAVTTTQQPAMTTQERGTRIGPYELLEKIGEGGFGLVYVAEQRQPVKRRVALKIIKLGMDTRQVIARFEAERQALAMMDHPNIAKVFDAGETDTGRPYFVMELVRGVPITEYCDTQNLDTKARLDLFTSICHAIQHAHQKGVIHRDIKPSNVLVTLHDGVPVPKVIDFGIAKATGAQLTDKTIYTQHRQMIGTPAYMSPEQAEMSGLDIDTRSDIYSLGVLLYELLTGTTPFDPTRLRSAAYGEMQRIIREEEPHKPSTRVSTLRVQATNGANKKGVRVGRSEPEAQAKDSSAITISKHHRTNTDSLARQLRGDLDWIVMKCLEKDRTRRYESANGIASDIRRHLENQPVEAGPPTAAYRFSKFARRNKGVLVAAAAVTASLILGLTLAVYGLIAAGIERDQKVAALVKEQEARAVAETERERANQEAAVAKAVNGFLVDELLAAVAPSSRAGRGKDVLMRDVLDQASKRIDRASRVGQRFENMPVVQASIHASLGATYLKLGELDAAERHLEQAHLLRREELGEEHPHTLWSMHDLVYLYTDQGQYDRAELLGAKTLEIRMRVLGEENRGTLQTMNLLAGVYKRMGRYAEAESLQVQALKIRKRVLGAEHRSTLGSMSNLASLYNKLGRYDEAELLFVETLGLMRQVLGEKAPYTLNCSHNLANLYSNTGREDEAEQLFIKTLGLMRSLFGEEALHTLNCMENLATVYRKTGREDEAEPLFIKALEIRKRVLGDEHPQTLSVMKKLASLYNNQGKTDEARPLVTGLIDAKRRRADRPGASSGDKNDCAWLLLTCEPIDLRDPETALRLARNACAMTNNTNPAYLDTLALAQHLTGDTPAAIATQQKALLLLPEGGAGRSDYEAALARYEAALRAPAEPQEVSPTHE